MQAEMLGPIVVNDSARWGGIITLQVRLRCRHDNSHALAGHAIHKLPESLEARVGGAGNDRNTAIDPVENALGETKHLVAR